MEYKKALLLILDGYGINERAYGNAIKAASTPVYDELLEKYPHNQLIACGEEVGLPAGIMGNSEVGHLNIGAGRIAWQLNVKIDKSIENGSFYENKPINSAIDHALAHKSSLHLMGLLSDGNVHSNMEHFYPILKLARQKGLRRVYLHAFMDGRDTLPHSGKEYLAKAEKQMQEIGNGKIATISGRYYAMDRDTNWQRVELAYRAMVHGEGRQYNSVQEAITDSYDEEVTDEFVIPTVIMENGKPTARITDNDSIIFFNYRGDRAREITSSLIYPEFDKFPVKALQNLKFVAFGEYDKEFNELLEVAFPPEDYPGTLAETVSNKGLKQLHLAETEKYAHVTFFFNGGREAPFADEERILVPSPKVATYDLQPEMSAYKVKDELVKALESEKYGFIVTNFANADMVGHTGDFSAAVQAVEAVDRCLSEILPAAQEHGYNVVLIADHGNADEMLDENGNVLTQHSTNPVPIVIALVEEKKYQVQKGRLSDVAPTILKIMGIPQPKEMTGSVLIK